MTVIIATILFFAAFFIALFTQYRAEVTVLKLITRLWTTNRNWRIRNYLIEDDQCRPQNCDISSSLINQALKTPTNRIQTPIPTIINNNECVTTNENEICKIFNQKKFLYFKI